MPAFAPPAPSFGVRAEGVDLAAGPSEDAFAELRAAFHRGGLRVVRGQRLTPARFHAFPRRIGRPEPQVIDPFHHPERADILIRSNVGRDGRPIGLADGGTSLHTDCSHLAEPARATMLHPATLADPDDPRTPWRITVEPPCDSPV